jgi:type III pantothenate kinase
VVDFGTAVTVNVVLAEGCFWGGLVMPGVDMMLDSLARGTSLLPRLRLRARPRGFGRTTQTAIAAGVFGLVAAGVRDAIESVERRTGRAFAVVLTGGDARLFCRALGRRVAVDSDLAGRGLAQVYRLNCRGQ